MPTADTKIIQAITDVQFLIDDLASLADKTEPQPIVERLNRIKIKLENAYAETQKGLEPLN